MSNKLMQCTKCSFKNSGNEHRDFFILKNRVLCTLCNKEVKKDQKQLEKARKKSKVQIV